MQDKQEKTKKGEVLPLRCPFCETDTTTYTDYCRLQRHIQKDVENVWESWHIARIVVDLLSKETSTQKYEQRIKDKIKELEKKGDKVPLWSDSYYYHLGAVKQLQDLLVSKEKEKPEE